MAIHDSRSSRWLNGTFGFAVVLGFVLHGNVIAQGPKSDFKDVQKSSPKVLAAFQDVVATPSQSTVRVLCDGTEVALGIVVGPDGWILTKYSELKNNPLCRFKDGKELPAKLVGVHDKHDIALLKVEAKNLKPVQWSESKVAPVGNWVASPGIGPVPVGIGVVSVATRNVNVKGSAPAPSPTSGYLGIGLDPNEAGVKINQVLPKTGAEKAGLKVNDKILAVNGEAVENADAFMTFLQRYKPDDVVTLKIVRGDKEMEIQATLGKRPAESRGDFQNNLGSKLSDRRTGFPTFLQHDTILKPTDCGGPLCDLDGKVIGINIARAGRTESYAVPSEAILPLLSDLMSGKLAPPSVRVNTTTADLLSEAKAAYLRAEIEKAEAEKKLAEAREALERAQAAQQKQGPKKDANPAK